MENILRQLGYSNKIDTFRARMIDSDRFLMFVEKDCK
jgi:hypothetical protein